MPLTLPIRLKKTAPSSRTVAANQRALNITLPTKGRRKNATRSSTPLRAKTLRAIAAALAVVDAGKALEIVKEAKENPENVIGATLDESALDQLKGLAAAVTAAEREKPEDGEEIADAVRSAARVIGADARLTAVAVRTLQGDGTSGYDSKMYAAALNWVAAIDYRLLEQAPRVGVKERMLNYVPASLESTEALEDRIEKLEEAVVEIRALLPKSAASASARGSK